MGPLATRYITCSAAVCRNSVLKNRSKIYESTVTNASEFMEELYRHFAIAYPKFYKMDNLSKLGFLASEVLLSDLPQIKNYRPEEVGVVLSNANSSLDTDIRFYQTVDQLASPALFVYTLPNIVIGEICIRNHFNGENAFFVSEKFDPVLIEQYVNNLINNNILQSCICGWVDYLAPRYEAVLYFVTKESSNPEQELVFNLENIKKIYKEAHE